jgi:nucleotide-binding universal stress UspA family protein
LPLDAKAQLTLLHVVPKGLPVRARRRAMADANKALAVEASELAGQLPAGVRIERIATEGAAALEIANHARAAQAELVILGQGGRTMRRIFLGSTAERVIRRAQLPVLVVRLPPRAPYRRPALALDCDPAAHAAVALLLTVIPPPRPTVAVIHAYDVPYQRLIYPSLSEADAEEQREVAKAWASDQVGQLLVESFAQAKVPPLERPAWRMHVLYGSPRGVIQKVAKKADTDVLALGTHGYSGLAHALLGTVAGDVLRDVHCDVLVVPPPRPA